MNQPTNKVVVAQMKSREPGTWTPVRKKKKTNKRLLRNTSIFAAAFLCLGTGVVFAQRHPDKVQSVMSHVTAGFEYDDTLGRLQFVSNLLPESAMVFLSGGEEMQQLAVPTSAKISHDWTQEEPWLEYACIGDVRACQDGEIMTIVKNRQDEYTVRVLHKDGCESIYSGLSTVHLKEQDTVSSGQQIGTATGFTAFELRKDGLSVLPVFAGI